MVKNILKRFGVLLLSLTLLLPYFPAYAWEDTDAETAEMGGGTNHFTIKWSGYQEPGSAPILIMHLHSNTTNTDYYGNQANFLSSDGKIRAKYAVKAGASLTDMLHAFGISDEKIKEHYSINPGGTANNGCYAKYNLTTNHGKQGEWVYVVYLTDLVGGKWGAVCDTDGSGGLNENYDWHIYDQAPDGHTVTLPESPSGAWQIQWLSRKDEKSATGWGDYSLRVDYGPNMVAGVRGDGTPIKVGDILNSGETVRLNDYMNDGMTKHSTQYGGRVLLGFKQAKNDDFNVTYDLNGGSGSFPMQTAKTNGKDFAKITTHSATPTKTGATFDHWEVKADFDNGDTGYSKGQVIGSGEEVKSKKGGTLPLIAIWKSDPGPHEDHSEIDFYGDGASEGEVETIVPPYNTDVSLPEDTGIGSLFDRILRSDEYTNLTATSGLETVTAPEDHSDEQECAFKGWLWEGTDTIGKTFSDFSGVKRINVKEIYPEPEEKTDTITRSGHYGGDNATMSGPHTGTHHEEHNETNSVNATVTHPEWTTATYEPGSAGWVRWTFYDEQQIDDDYVKISELYQQIKALKDTMLTAQAAMYNDVTGDHEVYNHPEVAHTYTWTDGEGNSHSSTYYTYPCRCYWVHTDHFEDPMGYQANAAAWQQQINELQEKVDGYKKAIEWLKSHPYKKDSGQSASFSGGVTASIPSAPPINMRARWEETDEDSHLASTEFAEGETTPEGKRSNHAPIEQLTATGSVANNEVNGAYHQMGWFDTDTNGTRLTDNETSFVLGAGKSYREDTLNGNEENAFKAPGNEKKIDPDTMEQPSEEAGKAVPVKGNPDDHYEWYAHWYSLVFYDTTTGLKNLFDGTDIIENTFYEDVDVKILNDGEAPIYAGHAGTTGISVVPFDSKELGYIGDEGDDFIDVVYRNDDNTHLENSPAGYANITRKPDVQFNGTSVNKSVLFVGWNTKPDGSGMWLTDTGFVSNDEYTASHKDEDGNLAEYDGKISYAGPDVHLYAQYRLAFDFIYDANFDSYDSDFDTLNPDDGTVEKAPETDTFYYKHLGVKEGDRNQKTDQIKDSSMISVSPTEFTFRLNCDHWTNPSHYTDNSIATGDIGTGYTDFIRHTVDEAYYDTNLQESVKKDYIYSFEGWSLDKDAYYRGQKVYACENPRRQTDYDEEEDGYGSYSTFGLAKWYADRTTPVVFPTSLHNLVTAWEDLAEGNAATKPTSTGVNYAGTIPVFDGQTPEDETEPLTPETDTTESATDVNGNPLYITKDSDWLTGTEFAFNDETDNGFIGKKNLVELLAECFAWNPYDNCTIDENGYLTVRTYAVWDKYPDIQAFDVSYSKEFVRNMIGEDGLDEDGLDTLKTVILSDSMYPYENVDSAGNPINGWYKDREDDFYWPRYVEVDGGTLDTTYLHAALNGGVDKVEIIGLTPSELLIKDDYGATSCSIQITDSAGNKTVYPIMIYLTTDHAGTSKDPDQEKYRTYYNTVNAMRFARFIDEANLYKTDENGNIVKDADGNSVLRDAVTALEDGTFATSGGLTKESKWRTEPELALELQNTLSDMGTDDYSASYTITMNGMRYIQSFTRMNGTGRTKNPKSFDNFKTWLFSDEHVTKEDLEGKVDKNNNTIGHAQYKKMRKESREANNAWEQGE